MTVAAESRTVAGDFNGDSRGDYVRLSSTTAHFAFALNNGVDFALRDYVYTGQKTLKPPVDFGWTPGAWEPIVGDFDGDGASDYARLGDTRSYVFLMPQKCRRYYRDEDGDGFGDPSGAIDECSVTPPAGYVINAKDGCDTDVRVKPGQTSFFIRR